MPNLIIVKSKKVFSQAVKKQIDDIENTSVNIFNNIDITTGGKNNTELSTKQIRSIIKETHSKPTLLKNKYIVLYNFDRANINVQNAFLKTLEEGSAKIFLQAKSVNNILPTVISRCQVNYLSSKLSFNKNIQQLLNEVTNGKINLLTQLAKKNNFVTITNNIEYYLYKNNINNKGSILKKFFDFKQKQNETNLNTELWLYYIFIN